MPTAAASSKPQGPTQVKSDKFDKRPSPSPARQREDKDEEELASRLAAGAEIGSKRPDVDMGETRTEEEGAKDKGAGQGTETNTNLDPFQEEELQDLRRELDHLKLRHSRFDLLVMSELHSAQLPLARRSAIVGRTSRFDDWKRFSIGDKKAEVQDVMLDAGIPKTSIVDVQIRGGVGVVELTTPDEAWAAVGKMKARFVATHSKAFAKGAQTTIMRLSVAVVNTIRSTGWKQGYGSHARLGRQPTSAHLLYDDNGEVIAASKLVSGEIQLWSAKEWGGIAETVLSEWTGIPIAASMRGKPTWGCKAEKDFEEADRKAAEKGRGKGKGKRSSKGKNTSKIQFPPALASDSAASGAPRAAPQSIPEDLKAILADPDKLAAVRAMLGVK